MATRYVSTLGNNANPGTATQPYRHVDYALGQVQAGDVVEVANGTYTYSHDFPNINANDIQLRAANSRQAILEFTGGFGWAKLVVNADRFTCVGIKWQQFAGGTGTVDIFIRGFGESGGANDFLIYDCAFYGAATQLKWQSGSGGVIDSCQIDSGANQGDGNVNLFNQSGTITRNNAMAVRGGGLGYDNKGGSDNCLIYNNLFTVVGTDPWGRVIVLGGNSASGTQGAGDDREARNCIACNNVVYDPNRVTEAALCIIGGADCWYINNVVIGSGAATLVTPSNPSGGNGWPGVTTCDNPHYVNNILDGCGGWDATFTYGGIADVDRNLFFNCSPPAYATNSVAGNPLFVSRASDWRTQSGSPARGAGRTVATIPKLGGGNHTAQTIDRAGATRAAPWDIGSYQAGGTVVTPPPTPPPTPTPGTTGEVIVQSTTVQLDATATTIVRVLPQAVQAGNTLLAFVYSWGKEHTTVPTDDRGNTWALVPASYLGDTARRVGVYYATGAAAGATTVTWTPPGVPDTMSMVLVEASGVGLPVVASGAHATAHPYYTGLTPTSPAASVAFVVVNHARPQGTPVSSGSFAFPDTLRADGPGTGLGRLIVGWRRLTGAATYEALVSTDGTIAAFAAAIAVFAAVAPAADTLPPGVVNIVANPQASGLATITFDTSEPALGALAFGPTNAYGYASDSGGQLLTAHTIQIGGLAAGTWHYRITATDAAGNAATTPDATFVVPGAGDTTPPIVANIAVTNRTASEAGVAWGTDEAADTQVEYGLTTAYGALTTLDATKATGHTATLAGLTPNTVYHFRVRSRDAAGNLAVSTDQTLTTLAAADTAAPTIAGVAETGITATGVTIGWATNEAADTQVEFGLTTSYGSLAPVSPADATTRATAHSVTLTGLAPGTTYHYRVRSRDAAGNLGVAVDRTFTTTAGAGPVPTGISPASRAAGGGAFTLTVNGTGFTTGSVVRWNGNSRATVFVSPTKLTALILASDVAQYGSGEITVT